MDKPVELIALLCLNCQTPVPAESDERAWVCAQCGQGLMLDEESGLQPLEVHYAAGIPPAGRGKPFWVASGRVGLTRETFDRSRETEAAERYWEEARRFFVPAYTCPLQEFLTLGRQYLTNPPAMQEGEAVSFEPVTLSVKDMKALAEFVVLAVEAERRDQLKQVEVHLQLEQPSLWVLP